MNRQSTSPQQSGQTGTGVTAREIVIADENARKLAGVFRLFLEDYDLNATRLRVGNIMQFYFEPMKISEILDDKLQEDFKLVYREITLSNKKLSDGAQGTKKISVVASKDDLPLKEDVIVDELIAKKKGIELEKMVVSADYIKNSSLDLIPIPESSYQTSRSLELALENEYQQIIAKLYPMKFQQFNSVFFRQLNDLYDKDLTEFEQPPEEPNQQIPESQEPQTPISDDLGTLPPTLANLTGVTG